MPKRLILVFVLIASAGAGVLALRSCPSTRTDIGTQPSPEGMPDALLELPKDAIAVDAQTPDANLADGPVDGPVDGHRPTKRATVTIDAPQKISSPITLPSLRFSGARDINSENTIRPFVDRAFAKLSYEIECLGRVCRVAQARDGTARVEDWAKALVSDTQMQANCRTLEMKPIGPEVVIYCDLGSSQEAAANQLLSDVFSTISKSTAIRKCRDSVTSSGEIAVVIKLDKTRHLISVLNGNLANSDFGSCVRRALDDIYSQVSVPTELTDVPEWPFVISAKL